MQLTHANLPYAYDALEPHLSRAALEFHHGQRHRLHVERAKTLAKQVRLHDLPLEQIILLTYRCRHHKGLLACAAEVWNYAFFWRSLRPGGGGVPNEDMTELLTSSFGSYRAFCDRFLAAATSVCAGGWVWLVLDGNKLAVHHTEEGETPLLRGVSPLVAFHAWANDGNGVSAQAFLENLLNWDFAYRNFERPRVARSRLDPYVSMSWRSTGL